MCVRAGQRGTAIHLGRYSLPSIRIYINTHFETCAKAADALPPKACVIISSWKSRTARSHHRRQELSTVQPQSGFRSIFATTAAFVPGPRNALDPSSSHPSYPPIFCDPKIALGKSNRHFGAPAVICVRGDGAMRRVCSHMYRLSSNGPRITDHNNTSLLPSFPSSFHPSRRL